jgi:hypothetical protein
MQGLFGRFGKKTQPPEVSSSNYRIDRSRDRLEDVDLPEYPGVANYEDDDEETNWADAEVLENENNPILRPQPVVPALATPTALTTPDPDDWDEALPAPTVKNSNRQEARRGKQPTPVPREEEIWDDDLPKPTFSPPEPLATPTATTTEPMERAVGLWTATIAQFRRILPTRLRRLSDPILTAIAIAIVTITIWAIDRLSLPGFEPSVATTPSTPVVTQPNSPTAEPLDTGIATPPQISPEQTFVEAIQTQLAQLTSQYPDNIVQNLQVDLATDRLIVRLAPVWYTLDDARQNEIVARMWNQAKTNNFSKLEVQDVEGKSIARSPVVGREMIILQRHQSA